MTPRQGRMLTVAEVADRMGLPRMVVFRMIHAGELPADRVGATFHVPEAALRPLEPERWVAESA